jgi:hypothetical protein
MANQTVAGLFDNYDDTAQAVRDLEAAGIDRPVRNRLYQDAGWKSFDPTAQPYTTTGLEEERRRYRR